jgi:hypothetical protein
VSVTDICPRVTWSPEICGTSASAASASRPAGRHVYDRAARQQATDTEAVTGGDGSNLVGGPERMTVDESAVSGIEMFLKVRGEVRAVALRIGTGDADQQEGNVPR